MSNVDFKSDDTVVISTLELLQAVFAGYQPRDFAARLWDGTSWMPDEGQPCHFTLVLNHPATLRRMFFPPTERRLGEAYMFGDFDIEGDIPRALNLAKHVWETWHWSDVPRYALKLLRLPVDNRANGAYQSQISGQRHSLERDKQAVQYHYDVSNEFYQLWLDHNMVYSCAYFASPDDDIHTAQERKLDYICRKLRLKSGETLLDIGCGWGSLMIHAAKHYGVHATGITLSEKQADYANQRIAEAGLSSQCRVIVQDYRAVDESYQFDKIASIGMVEHVGRDNMLLYFEKVYRLLRPGGVFLNHGITAPRQLFRNVNAGRGKSFVQQYIFPDGDILGLDFLLAEAQKAKFEVWDVENLREHYALTLQNWYERYEAQKPAVIEMLGMISYRLWRIYLASARWLFQSGLLAIHQTLLYKLEDNPNHTNLPLTRDDWYAT